MTLAKEESNFNTEDTAHNRGKLTTEAIAGAGKRDVEELADEAIIGSQSDRTNGRENALEPLFDSNVDQRFRDRWREIQTGFVDEPRQAVKRADELVAELMQQLAQSFSDQRNNLEHQWGASDEVSTEELRVALTRYRSFFERLLSV
jgi:ElaB/YqjD/DUF883 family membrane-anchored ribosome-binding protein